MKQLNFKMCPTGFQWKVYLLYLPTAEKIGQIDTFPKDIEARIETKLGPGLELGSQIQFSAILNSLYWK